MQSQQPKIQNRLILNFGQSFGFQDKSRPGFTSSQRLIWRPLSFKQHPKRLFLRSFVPSRVVVLPNNKAPRFFFKPLLPFAASTKYSLGHTITRGKVKTDSVAINSLNYKVACFSFRSSVVTNWEKTAPFIQSCCKKKFFSLQKAHSNPAFKESVYSPLIKFKIPDFLNIQRLSFRHFLNEGLITEFKKYNSIYNSNQTFEIFFYAEQYKLNRPKWTPKQAILKRKSYSCQLYLPVQISNHLTEESQLQWVLLANIPLMTKHGHFILNGCPRVLMNQMVRSPGVYFQKLEKKNNKVVYCADFIAQRGSWLRLEVDTKKGDIWAKLKKTPKIPIFVLLRALGLSLPVLNNSIDFGKLRYLLQFKEESKTNKKIKEFLLQQPNLNNSWEVNELRLVLKNLKKYMLPKPPKKPRKKKLKKKLKTWETPFACETYFESLLELCKHLYPQKTFFELGPLQAQKFLFRKFQNSRSYDLSVLGRLRINQKLGLCISPDHTTLTAQDIFVACLFLMDLLQGLVTSDDIDDLKNRKIKPSGELVQTQLATGLSRLDKLVREKLKQPGFFQPSLLSKQTLSKSVRPTYDLREKEQNSNFFSDLFTVKPLNQSFREFFGTSPLSQLMDQTNALSELTHKRRLSSLGPGGINRETAGMAIRGIHPTHYGRICPIETPEGQNAGLVNSFTIYSHLNTKGFIETPFYKTYKGFVLKNKNPLLFSSDQERSWVLAPGDIKTSLFNFLPSGSLPSRQLKEFQRVSRNEIHFTSMSPIQMISVATSLIPFLEHNDGNRALMGSNMQRQAVPTIRPSKPIVGTGLESRVVSDVGHGLQVQSSGFVSYVDGKQIVIYSKLNPARRETGLKPFSLLNLSETVMSKRYSTPFETLENRYFFKKSFLFLGSTLSDKQSCFKKSEERREGFENSGQKESQLVYSSSNNYNQLDSSFFQKPFIFKINSNIPLKEYPVRSEKFLKVNNSLGSAQTTRADRQPEFFSEKFFNFNCQTLSKRVRPTYDLGSGQYNFQAYFKDFEEETSKSFAYDKYSDPFLSIFPFQTKRTKNTFNTKQQAFLYNQLFLNDFLGQLELANLFSKTIVYSKLSNKFKPFFSNRSFFLINQFSHQKLLNGYCQLILAHFYKKQSRSNQKKNFSLVSLSNKQQGLQKLPFETLLKNYGKPFFSKEATKKHSNQNSKNQKENPFWYRPFFETTFDYKTLTGHIKENNFVQKKKNNLSFIFCTATGVSYVNKFKKRILFSNQFGYDDIAADLVNKRLATNQAIKTVHVLKPQFFDWKKSRFLIWCQNFCKREILSELPNRDLIGLLNFYPSAQSKILVKKRSSETFRASPNSVSLFQPESQTFDLLFYPNLCFKESFLSNVFLRSASVTSLTKSSFFKANFQPDLTLREFQKLWGPVLLCKPGATQPIQESDLRTTYGQQKILGNKASQTSLRFSSKTSKEFLKSFLKFNPSTMHAVNSKKFEADSWNLPVGEPDKEIFSSGNKLRSEAAPSEACLKLSSSQLNLKTPCFSWFDNQIKKSVNISVPSNLSPSIYNLNNYHRSNQDTYMVHRPVVQEGQWVEKGDLLADSSASVQGELAIGQNILVGYTPWEGYNFEDAVLISERLIYDDLYTSLHIERYEVEVRDTQYGMEQITNQIPNKPDNCNYIDHTGIAPVGTWVEEGDILVGKIAPLGQKKLTPYENLLYDILGKEVPKTRDTSLRVPKGASGRVLHVEIVDDQESFQKTSGSSNNKFYTGPIKPGVKSTLTGSKKSSALGTQNYFSFQTENHQKSFQKLCSVPRPAATQPVQNTSTGRIEASGKSIRFRRGKSVEKTIRPNQRLWNKEMEVFTKNEPFHQTILKTKLLKSLLKNLMGSNPTPSLPDQAMDNFGRLGLDDVISISNFSPYGERGSLPTSFSFERILKKRLSILKAGSKLSSSLKWNDSFQISNQYLQPSSSQKKIYKDVKGSRKELEKTSSGPYEVRRSDSRMDRRSSATVWGPYEGPAEVSRRQNLTGGAIQAKAAASKKGPQSLTKTLKKEIGPLPMGFSGPKKVHIYLAEKRKLQIGDKIAGRHGNKGIISNILPRQDMPYLPDGTPLDIVLNPLGVPSRMNVGQIFECLLGIAGYYLKQNYKIQPFDEIYGCEASRSLVYSKLYEARIKTGQDWLFNPNFPGKTRLFDGRNGECFEQPVTVGVAYILKLVHLVDDKIHARSTGPYSLVTQQPLRGRSKQGGQRVGEMEVWALEGFGAAYILQEILTIKSDDLKGRNQVMESILNNQPFYFGFPESFKVLVRELQSLCLDIAIYKHRENQAPTKTPINKL
uniref:DNA-directed RNA polymerase subunit beta n=1 Tax=Sarcinofilum mucosum TaxID=141643 RepID=A0A1W6EGA9_SARMC|nr:beta subunit of RNA polymerase [Sarcinofilum mucosum]ARK14428.1 beta subunit of RNA polymerase [Sarcinofilum mucosum]